MGGADTLVVLMKIKSINVIKHPVLGDLALDFSNEFGVFDTVIFAGDNGSGKTVLLNMIFEFSNPDIKQSKRGDLFQGKQTFVVVLSDEEVSIFTENENTRGAFSKGIVSNELAISRDYALADWNQISVSLTDIEGNTQAVPSHLLNNNPIFKKMFTSIFSGTEVNFTATSIQSTTSQELDQPNTASKKSSPAIASEIAQLLVDIDSNDNAELAHWVDEHPGEAPIEEIKGRRLGRFKNAFHGIFPTKRLNKIEPRDGQKVISFIENGKLSDVNQLSSGEKQIVFRGGFILKDLNSVKGAIILIDEPEISLHPKWQQKILAFFKDLFTNKEGKQTSQIFIATHSPYLLQSAKNCCVCILKKAGDGRIETLPRSEYFGWTPDQLTIEAFGLASLRPPEVSLDLSALREMMGAIRRGELSSDDGAFLNLRSKLSSELIDGDYELIGIELLDSFVKIKNK